MVAVTQARGHRVLGGRLLAGLAAGAVATLGRRRVGWAVGYALLIGTGFLASPAVQAMGVGFFASHMPAMIATVYLAHLVWGVLLWLLLRRWLPEGPWLRARSGGEGRHVRREERRA